MIDWDDPIGKSVWGLLGPFLYTHAHANADIAVPCNDAKSYRMRSVKCLKILRVLCDILQYRTKYSRWPLLCCRLADQMSSTSRVQRNVTLPFKKILKLSNVLRICQTLSCKFPLVAVQSPHVGSSLNIVTENRTIVVQLLSGFIYLVYISLS